MSRIRVLDYDEILFISFLFIIIPFILYDLVTIGLFEERNSRFVSFIDSLAHFVNILQTYEEHSDYKPSLFLFILVGLYIKYLSSLVVAYYLQKTPPLFQSTRHLLSFLAAAICVKYLLSKVYTNLLLNSKNTNSFLFAFTRTLYKYRKLNFVIHNGMLQDKMFSTLVFFGVLTAELNRTLLLGHREFMDKISTKQTKQLLLFDMINELPLRFILWLKSPRVILSALTSILIYVSYYYVNVPIIPIKLLAYSLLLLRFNFSYVDHHHNLIEFDYRKLFKYNVNGNISSTISYLKEYFRKDFNQSKNFIIKTLPRLFYHEVIVVIEKRLVDAKSEAIYLATFFAISLICYIYPPSMFYLHKFGILIYILELLYFDYTKTKLKKLQIILVLNTVAIFEHMLINLPVYFFTKFLLIVWIISNISDGLGIILSQNKSRLIKED
jgi:hypothetical protein